LGRETAIQAIAWDDDGWPRLRHGGWHAAVEVEVPDVPDSPDGASQNSESGGPDLGWPWSTLREPVNESWADTTSRPGWIRLRARHGPESLWDQSLLAQRITEHQARVEVTIDARPATFTQAAGLVLWYNTEAYLALDLTWTEPGRTALMLTTRDSGGLRRAAVREVPAGQPVTVGATIDGADAQFWVRSGGGGREEPIGGVLDFSELSDDAGGKLRFTGAFAGIRAHDLVDGVFCADFHGFRLASVTSAAW
jgi:xylan 1,4-beta-xylosidase